MFGRWSHLEKGPTEVSKRNFRSARSFKVQMPSSWFNKVAPFFLPHWLVAFASERHCVEGASPPLPLHREAAGSIKTP